ncbi:MAG TPA: hypothetical protein HA346_01805 [Thermoplasmata archaeon]|nr:hypothetical protein [Thermoplasmata archaeon]
METIKPAKKKRRKNSLFLTSKFIYLNAKVAAMGSPFLQEQKLTELSGLRSLEDFKSLLNSHKDYSIKGESAGEIQEELDEHLPKFLELVKKDSPKQVGDFWDAYLDSIEKEHLKKASYKLMRGEKLEDKKFQLEKNRLIYLDLQQLKEYGEEWKALPALFRTHDFPESVIKFLEQKPLNKIKFEAEFERFSLSRLASAPLPASCKKTSRKFVLQLRDLLNLKVIFRAKEIKLPPGLCRELLLREGWELADWKLEELIEAWGVEGLLSRLEGTSWAKQLRDAFANYQTEGIYSMEKALDENFMKKMVELSQGDNLGIAPSIRFVVEKQYEIQNLKAVAKGIEEVISPERIRKLLIKVSS